MRALALVSILLSLLVPAARSDELRYATLIPKTAKSMAMGGVFSAVPTSEFSFFGNPAFFTSDASSFALPSLDVWSYGPPSSALSRFGSTFTAAGGGDFLSRSFEIMSKDGASGGGASVGLSLAGKNLGLGFFLTTDNRVRGSGPGAAVSSDTEADLILGLGFPVRLGSARLSIGGDLRPFYRIVLRDESGGDPSLTDLVDNGSESLYADAFFGAAMDLGASIGLGAFTLGLSVRDLAPAYPVSTEKLSKLQSTLGSGNMPDTSSSLEARPIPSLSAGLAWKPRLVPGKLDGALYLELQDIVGAASDWEGPESALDLLHVGAEIGLFKILTLRGGYNGGKLSAGAGVKLLFLDVNVALFTEKAGALPGDDSLSGLALQAAIRL